MPSNQSADREQTTLEFIFNYTKHAPEVLLDDITALDAKVVHILSFASIVIGLTTFALERAPLHWLPSSFLGVAVVAYVILAITAINHLKGKQVRRALHADVLWTRCSNDDIHTVMCDLAKDIGEAYHHNMGVIRDKSRSLWRVALLAAIEVIAVGCFALLLALGVPS